MCNFYLVNVTVTLYTGEKIDQTVEIPAESIEEANCLVKASLQYRTLPAWVHELETVEVS